MARAPAMDPDARRAAIVAAARSVFARKGYHATGIADIVDELQIARGTFYRYFDSKRAIFQVVLGDMMEEVGAVVEPIAVDRPIPEQIWANLDRLVRAITAQDVCRVLFAESVGIDAEADEALRSFYGVALTRIERALHTGQALGVVRQGDVRLLARCLLGLLKEPVVQASLDREELDERALVEEIVGILRGGVLR
ncbi:MAG: helix-turn-helix domain-containing protein [Myxococcota bacterium]